MKVGDDVEIIGMKEGATKSTVTGVEMFKKLLNQGQAGDNVGLLLRGIKREDVQRGQVRHTTAELPTAAVLWLHTQGVCICMSVCMCGCLH